MTRTILALLLTSCEGVIIIDAEPPRADPACERDDDDPTEACEAGTDGKPAEHSDETTGTSESTGDGTGPEA